MIESHNMIQIRPAKQPEITWINSSYDEVGFAHSSFEKEIIAIAEINGQRAGLGRLVTIDVNHFELGGIYVFEAFRGQGIARKIVEFLLKASPPSKSIYCIPFEHLVPFYREFGFIPCVTLEQIPQEILAKCRWCKDRYSNPTGLLVLKKNLT